MKSGRGWWAPVAAATVVVALAVGAVIITRPDRPPASRPDSTPATRPAAGPSPVLAHWSAFPVHVMPRPVVLLGEQTAGPDRGFFDVDTKEAFLDGRVTLAAILPASPASAAGYPILPAAAAARLITTPRPGTAATVMLSITRVVLGSHEFLTDRGMQVLPAWQMHLSGTRSDVYVLAVAPAGRFSHGADGRADEGRATLGPDGRSVTIAYPDDHPPGGCSAGQTSSLQVTETPTAVLLVVSVHITGHRKPPPGVICPFADNAPMVTARPVAGAPNTRTITLDQPLGARVIIGGSGQPYEVTG